MYRDDVEDFCGFRPGLATLSERRAAMSGSEVALVYLGDQITYREVHSRVLIRAAALAAAGVGKGDRVAYLGENHPALIETMLAVVRIGGVFLPLNNRLTHNELHYQLTDSAASALILGPERCADSESFADASFIVDVAVWSPDPVAAPAIAVPAAQVGGTDPAFLLYTSGTTGRPKGAILSHENLLWNSFNLMLDVDVRSDEVALVSAPMFHVAALNQLVVTVYLKGGRSVIAPKWDADLALDLIESHGVTWMFGVATMFADLTNSARWAHTDLASIRSVMSGGAPIPRHLIDLYMEKGITFCQGYGLTETAPGATFLPQHESVRKAGSAGAQVMFDEVMIVDADGTECPPGTTGEIIIRGPNVSTGYWRNPAATATAFSDGGWFHSGDIGYRDTEGFFFIVDRLKDMYISGGENVYPAEVEAVLFEHPDVAEAAVIGMPDDRWGEVGHAFVVSHEDALINVSEVQEFASTRLARYKVPKRITVVPRLPRTGSGKVRKTALRSDATHEASVR